MAPKTPAPSRTNGHHPATLAQPKLDLAGPEIQRFDTLRALPIGLPDKAKASSCRLLNEILADSMVLYALYKKHHWLSRVRPSTSSICCSTSTPRSRTRSSTSSPSGSRASAASPSATRAMPPS